MQYAVTCWSSKSTPLIWALHILMTVGQFWTVLVADPLALHCKDGMVLKPSTGDKIICTSLSSIHLHTIMLLWYNIWLSPLFNSLSAFNASVWFWSFLTVPIPCNPLSYNLWISVVLLKKLKRFLHMYFSVPRWNPGQQTRQPVNCFFFFGLLSLIQV